MADAANMEGVRIPQSTTDFFPNIKDNLTKVTWAHAVNSADYLHKVLESGDIMMIEADVIMGTLTDDPSGVIQPVMGHPPNNTSDISLQQFLRTIDEANHRSPTVTMKGVKLDFKSIEVYEKSLKIVDSLYEKIQYPMWINADILPGPVESQVLPVDAARFLNASKKFSAAMLSIGWTTRYGGNLTEGSYTASHIANMLGTLKSSDMQQNQSITFPVRAGLAANSLPELTALLTATTGFNSTLTVWSSSGDYVDIPKLRELILSCGLDRIYLDVPKDISDQLHL